MLATIDFNHEAVLQTDEVHHEPTYRVLATKAMAMELTLPQMLPKAPFGIRHLAPQAPRKIAFLTLAHPCAP